MGYPMSALDKALTRSGFSTSFLAPFGICSGKRKLIIDTDTGVDDAEAIIACASQPGTFAINCCLRIFCVPGTWLTTEKRLRVILVCDNDLVNDM
jgi:hypothetical protein